MRRFAVGISLPEGFVCPNDRLDAQGIERIDWAGWALISSGNHHATWCLDSRHGHGVVKFQTERDRARDLAPSPGGMIPLGQQGNCIAPSDSPNIVTQAFDGQLSICLLVNFNGGMDMPARCAESRRRRVEGGEIRVGTATHWASNVDLLHFSILRNDTTKTQGLDAHENPRAAFS